MTALRRISSWWHRRPRLWTGPYKPVERASFDPCPILLTRIDDHREYVLRMGIGYDQDGNAEVENPIVVRAR